MDLALLYIPPGIEDPPSTLHKISGHPDGLSLFQLSIIIFILQFIINSYLYFFFKMHIANLIPTNCL